MIEFVKTGSRRSTGAEADGRAWIERHGGGVLGPIRRPPPTSFRNDDDAAWAAPGGGRLGAFRRRLRDLQVHFLSLVPAAANQRTVLVKSAEGSGRIMVEKQVAIVKADPMRRVVYGIVYAPDEVDTDGDTVSAAEIEEAAYDFMQSRRTGQIDTDHDGVAGKGFVAESWIIRRGDPLFPTEAAGAWAVGIKVTDEAAWQRVERGELRGISMAGLARAAAIGTTDAAGEGTFVLPSDDEAADATGGLVTRLRKLLGLGADSLHVGLDEDPMGAVAKAAAQREQALCDLSRRADLLDARLAAIEYVSPGRQSRLGGPDAAFHKGKGFRGLRIV